MNRKDFIRSLTGLALIPVVGRSEELHNELFVYDSEDHDAKMIQKIRDYKDYEISDSMIPSMYDDDDDYQVVILYDKKYKNILYNEDPWPGWTPIEEHGFMKDQGNRYFEIIKVNGIFMGRWDKYDAKKFKLKKEDIELIENRFQCLLEIVGKADNYLVERDKNKMQIGPRFFVKDNDIITLYNGKEHSSKEIVKLLYKAEDMDLIIKEDL